MKKLLLLCMWVLCFCPNPLIGHSAETTTSYPETGEYTLIVEGYDWGAAASKVILSTGKSLSETNHKDFQVEVKRATSCAELTPEQASGKRQVLHAYVSDAKGNKIENGNFITLVLFVSPFDEINSPVKYFRNDKCRGNQWIDYQLTITDTKSKQVWNKEAGKIIPLIDDFDLSGRFTYNKMAMSYASFTPKSQTGKSPLIIWLHGGGEGGTDASIPLLANRAANYASPEIQTYFGGAYVLAPQSPTAWMDNGNGSFTRGKENDIYNEALMALIKDFVANHPQIDQDRIYLGGCSNGGYMTLKLVLLYPDYFAAAFPSALAYQSEYISDEQMQRIKDVPIWFVHSKDDPVTVPENTVVPVHKRLLGTGAKNVHFSFFDHVVDITGLFGGDQYYYSGHWSWIYSHANKCQWDYDGEPVTIGGRAVTIMEWLAAQQRD